MENPYAFRECENSGSGDGLYDLTIGEFMYKTKKTEWLKSSAIIFCRVIILLPIYFCVIVPLSVVIIIFAMIAVAILWHILDPSKIPDMESLILISFLFSLPALICLLAFICPILIRVEEFMIRKLFGKPLDKPADAIPARFTSLPRQCKGHRATVLDADDIGWVRVKENGIEFSGEHTKLFIPAGMIASQRLFTEFSRSGGGLRTKIELQFAQDLPFQACIIAENAGYTLTGGRRIAKRLHEKIVSITESYDM